jgi:hypothetical protein
MGKIASPFKKVSLFQNKTLDLSVKGNRGQVSLRYPHYVLPETRLVSCSIEAREKAKANLKLVAI